MQVLGFVANELKQALQLSKTDITHCKQSFSNVMQAGCLSHCHGMQVLDTVTKLLKQALQLSKTDVMKCKQSCIEEKQSSCLSQLAWYAGARHCGQHAQASSTA